MKMLVDVAERTVLMLVLLYLMHSLLSSVNKGENWKWTNPSALKFPINVLHNQGIYLMDTRQIYLSEYYAPQILIYDANAVTVKEEKELRDINNKNPKIQQLRNQMAEDNNEVDVKCSGGFLSRKVVSSGKLKEMLMEVERKYSKKGFRLSIPIDNLGIYYLTQGLVPGCETVILKEVVEVIIVKLKIPLVKINTEFEFKRVIGLHFQNSFENSICSGMNNETEYILVKNKTIIPIPTTKQTNDTVNSVYFDKCRIGPELHVSQIPYYTICHLDLDNEGLSNVKMAFADNYFSCLEAVYEGNSTKRMEEHCQLENCHTASEMEEFQHSFISVKEHILTNIKETIKVRCSNRSHDVTIESPPVDGTLIFSLTCGCELFHGKTSIAKMERCNKNNHKSDFSKEKVKIFQLLPSNYLKDFHGYVLSVKYLSPINSIFVIKCVIILVEIYLYFYGIRLTYLIFLTLFGGRRVFFNNVCFMDLIGIYYVLVRFLPYWLPGWFLRQK